MSAITDTNHYKKIGVVVDAHGIRGELYVLLFSGDSSWLSKIAELRFVQPHGNTEAKSTDLKIKKIKTYKKGFICSFSQIQTRNQAEELKKAEVWVSANLLVSADGDQPFLSELLNFTIEDSLLGSVGQIIDFSTNGNQDLLVLDKKVNGQNIEIPFVKNFVQEVNYKTKTIHTTLPEGLLQINEKD